MNVTKSTSKNNKKLDILEFIKIKTLGDFPGGPVVKTPCMGSRARWLQYLQFLGSRAQAQWLWCRVLLP